MSYDLCPSLSDSLHSVCMTVSRPVRVAPHGVISLFFMAESYSSVSVHHIFIRSSVNGHLGCFHVLAVVNSAVVNIGVHISFQTVCFSLDICPRMGLLIHMVALFSVFLRNLLSVFCSGYTNLLFLQLFRMVSFSPYLLHYFLFLDFLVMTILTGMR